MDRVSATQIPNSPIPAVITQLRSISIAISREKGRNCLFYCRVYEEHLLEFGNNKLTRFKMTSS